MRACGTLADARCSSLRLLAVCLLAAGRIRLIDDGNTPLGSSEAMALLRLLPFLRPGLKLLGDRAYGGDERCLTPYGTRDLSVASAGSVAEANRRRAYNQALSSVREKVEHTFSRVKRMWRMLDATWQMDLAELPRAFRAACLLSNWLAPARGLF